MQDQDTSLIKAQLSDDKGNYEFRDIEKGSYRLQIVMLGFENYLSESFAVETDKTLPLIILESVASTLTTVEVSAKKPFLEQRAGTLVVNVSNSITAASGTATDVLRKVPGLLVIQDRISLAGQQNVTILIDGRPTQYVDINALLRDMPSSNIDRIEVVSQPGARYDAQGTGGVINIILKRNVKLGFNGSTTIGTGYGKYLKYRASTSLNYRNPKINSSNYLGFNHRSGYEELLITRRIEDERYAQINQQPSFPYSLNVKTGLDYFLTEKQTVGASVSLIGNVNNSTNKNFTDIFENESLKSSLLTTNDIERRRGYIFLDGFYRWEIDTTGHQLQWDASINRYAREEDNLLSTRVDEDPAGADFPNRRQSQPSFTTIYASSLDYTLPFGKNFTLEAGLKYSDAKIDNDLQSFVFQNGNFENDPSLSNHFIFEEKISAAYLSSNLQFDKIEVQAGLRYEDSRSTGNSVTLDSITERKFQQLFPSASISAPVYKKFGFATSYSYRINRPNYRDLNPFIYYFDPYTYQKGNPFLRPILTHSYKASITYDKQPFINFEYSRTKDEIQLVTEQNDATGEAFGTSENLDRYDRIGGSIFFPLSFVKGLDGYGGFMAFYNRYRSDLLGELFDKSRWNTVAFINASYKLPQNWTIEANGWWVGPGIEGIQIAEQLYGVDFGVQKKFWNENATLNLSFDNAIFRYWNGSITHSNIDFDIESRWEAPIVNAIFTYNFGNQYLKKSKTRKSSAEDEKRRINDK